MPGAVLASACTGRAQQQALAVAVVPGLERPLEAKCIGVLPAPEGPSLPLVSRDVVELLKAVARRRSSATELRELLKVCSCPPAPSLAPSGYLTLAPRPCLASLYAVLALLRFCSLSVHRQ